MSEHDDQSRKAILARRARFMAAALTATTGCDLFSPQVCLSPRRQPDSTESAQPADPGTPDDGWAEQRAKAKAAEEAAAARTADAGTPSPAQDQIPEHRRRASEERLRERPHPRACLRLNTIQVIRGADGSTDPEPTKK
jgi:hypothetical protein